MLQPWESGIDFDDRVYPNLVCVFNSNIELSTTRLVRIVTQVGGEIYTPRKAFSFADFVHKDGVHNICRRRDLSNDICALPFLSQLLPLKVCIFHTILQHIIIPRNGHLNEVMRLDVGLLDSLITG